MGRIKQFVPGAIVAFFSIFSSGCYVHGPGLHPLVVHPHRQRVRYERQVDRYTRHERAHAARHHRHDRYCNH